MLQIVQDFGTFQPILFEVADFRVELGRLFPQFGALGFLALLALDGGSKALLGIRLPLAPFGLLARRRVRAFTVSGRLPRLGGGLGPRGRRPALSAPPPGR